MSPDGRVLSTGSLSNALAKEKKLSAEAAQEIEQLQQVEKETFSTDTVVTTQQTSGKLVVAEEISVGHVSWTARESQKNLRLQFILMFHSQAAVWQHRLWDRTLFVLGNVCRDAVRKPGWRRCGLLDFGPVGSGIRHTRPIRGFGHTVSNRSSIDVGWS